MTNRTNNVSCCWPGYVMGVPVNGSLALLSLVALVFVGSPVADAKCPRKWVFYKTTYGFIIRSGNIHDVHQQNYSRLGRLTGIGSVKLTVVVMRRTHDKVQYCITAISPDTKKAP